MTRRPPLVIGHRGAPGYRPEHSRSAYELAIEMGVDAVEPDVVATKDGVLVVRHENEISGTTDVSARPEFAARRTTKRIDGQSLTGWFTEDFTWDELATLRCRERLPHLRRASASFDDRQPILRLVDVLELVGAAGAERGRAIGVVLEVKHATYFAGLGLDLAPLVERDLRAAGWPGEGCPLTIESFEPTVLAQLRERGVEATYVQLIEAAGKPYDLAAASPTYRSMITPEGLDRLVGRVDGISVDKRIILAPTKLGRMGGPTSVVSDAHARGLAVFTWTCRPENAFLVGEYRRGSEPRAFGDYEAEWAVIRDTGIDGVFVDHADLGVGFFGGRVA